MNLSDIKIEVKRLTGRNDNAFDDRIEKAINRAIREWARSQPWGDLKTTYDITHQGGRGMALPSDVLRCEWVLDTTNTRAVAAVLQQWDREDEYSYSKDQTGYADKWKMAEFQPVFTTVTSYLEIATSSSSDVVAVYTAGRVLDTGASAPYGLYDTGETINLVGVSPVTSTLEYQNMSSISKSDESIGVVRVKSNGSLVGLIGPDQQEARYPWIQFMDVPAALTVFRTGVYREPRPLVRAYQAPPPAVEQDYIVWQASSDIFWQLHEGDRAVGAMRKARDIAKDRRGVELRFGDYDAQIVPTERD